MSKQTKRSVGIDDNSLTTRGARRSRTLSWDLRSDSLAAEPPPETKRIRLVSISGVCVAPQYVSEELLRVEGFTDVQYVKLKLDELYKAFASGDVDISMAFVPPFIVQIDAGEPILLLGGVHAGCSNCSGATGCALSEI